MKKLQKNILIVSVLCYMLICGCGRQEELILLQSGEAGDISEVACEEQPVKGLAVYICGEVKCPGVVYLEEGARVVDAVEAAGGLTEAADREYVNLAAYVSDGEKLYIPDVAEGQELIRQEELRASGYVNINTADAALLMTLPGIGESRAQDIIAYRNEHGDFTSIEELMKISGIKENLFAKIKDKIIVE